MTVQVSLFAQKISISVENKPLSEVLVQLRDRYDMSFSFNDAELKKYSVSAGRHFQNTEEVLEYLLKDLPLAYEKTGNVYVIYTKRKKSPEKPVMHLLSGRVVERGTMEPLPYTNIAINGTGTISSEDGYFSHRSADSIFHVQISHLGYYIIDTILKPDRKHRIKLTPSVKELKEIVVTDRLLETFLYSEDRAGVVQMNHKITRFLPGGSNNSVFNLLRLQPGISATAEASENLIIWGSYEGQSRTLFDDIVLFGLKNFNENIGTVNPLVVKDIKLMKAAFGADYGDCVGGIADITGKNGNRKKLSMDAAVDNYTINSMLETPVGKNSSLVLALRHTYRSLYDNMTLDIAPNRETAFNSELTILPDYMFRDLNLKYTFRNEQDFHVKVSLLAGQDNFSYEVDEMLTSWLRLRRNTKETSLQKGASLEIGKDSKNGMSTQLSMSFSELDARYENEQKAIDTFNNTPWKSTSQKTFNSTRESKIKLKSTWAVNKHHQLEGALAWVGNSSSWDEDTSGVDYINQNIHGSHITLMAQDRMTFNRFRLIPGIRFTHLPYPDKFYAEPRISASYKITEGLNLNLSAGLYRQFLTKNSVKDEYGNYRYMWTVANDLEYPVLRARHILASITLEKNQTQASFSPFSKKTKGITRYVNFLARDTETISEGHSTSYGFDIYLKQNFFGHTAWVSYTLSKTEETFDHFPDNVYTYAPQDQRHELKLATMLNFDPVYFSASYIYGSGYAIPKIDRFGIQYERYPYHRVDAALTTKFNFSKIYGEAGISILNVFDHENLLYNNLERVPTSQTSTIQLYQQSVPFTPTLYLKIGF
jgi:hypothetical protein